MLSCHVAVGRLIEIRGRETLDLPQFSAFRTEFTDALMKIGRRSIFMADLRGMQVVSTQVYEALLRLMKTDVPLLERVAYLLDPGSLLEININQVIESAANPNRKVCLELDEVEGWLGPLLVPDELARLRQFLAP